MAILPTAEETVPYDSARRYLTHPIFPYCTDFLASGPAWSGLTVVWRNQSQKDEGVRWYIGDVLRGND